MYFKRCSKRPKNSSTNSTNNCFLSQNIKQIATLITIIIILSTTSVKAEGETQTQNHINYENKKFKGDFFVEYAKEKLKDKFPFDILGTNPGGESSECPKINLYDNDIELCLLRDAINALKIPFQITIAIIFYQKI